MKQRRWAYRFLKRNGLSNRRITHKAQVQSEDAVQLTTSYVESILQTMTKYDIPWSNVVNMDETSVPYHVDNGRTIDFRGTKSVDVLQPGNNRKTVTVVLSVAFDGEKLPPYVVYKGSRTGTLIRKVNNPIHGYAAGNIHSVQKNGWMDTTEMIRWIKKVWIPFTKKRQDEQKGQFFLLTMDVFSAHCVHEVKSLLMKHRTMVVHVPQSCTSIAQLLDVGINRPFKQALQNQCHQHIQRTENARIAHNDVSVFVEKAWEVITPAMVTNTAARIGFLDRETE